MATKFEFVVWEMRRNVSVVRLIVAILSSGPPASQPVSWLTRLSTDVIWLRVPTQYGCCSWVLVQCVSSHRIVGKCIGILWNRECLLFALIWKTRTFQNMARRAQILSGRKWWPLPAHVMMSHLSHNERTAVQISLQYLHWC